MRRPWGAILVAVLVILTAASAPASPTTTFQCEKTGGTATIVNACGARWEAANVRAHVALGRFGDSNAACLTRYAALLEKLATQWVSASAFHPYSGPWPCGKRPKVGSEDDGLLADACPGGVWTYENRGRPACAGRARAAADSGPSFEQTARWISDNLDTIARGARSDGMTTAWHDFAVTKCNVELGRTEASGTTSYQTSFTVPFAQVDRILVRRTAPLLTSAGESFTAPIVVDVTMAAPRLVHYVSTGPLGTGDTNELIIFTESEGGANRLANALRRLAVLCHKDAVF
jgi:hypothetical protein